MNNTALQHALVEVILELDYLVAEMQKRSDLYRSTELHLATLRQRESMAQMQEMATLTEQLRATRSPLRLLMSCWSSAYLILNVRQQQQIRQQIQYPRPTLALQWMREEIGRWERQLESLRREAPGMWRRKHSLQVRMASLAHQLFGAVGPEAVVIYAEYVREHGLSPVAPMTRRQPPVKCPPNLWRVRVWMEQHALYPPALPSA